ncbi:DUF5694 domain-containing protein [Soonwooa sp.]|uniref:DUF5694 domain-containing protein n=1 Tax=Soonwooa sp. TaxID=1938592 RepID=UPI002622DAAD|nr:DUF5694 domain-containing protein [Soonwooa sp.]
MKTLVTAFFIILSTFNFAQDKINVILIGTFHFNNPGLDAAKVKERNILEQSNQNDLNQIVKTLKSSYKPDKVFVENPFEDRKTLDKRYDLYKQGKAYYKADTMKYAFDKRMLNENEIYQLGFRLAKEAGNQKIYSIDYPSDMNLGALENKISLNPSLSMLDFQTRIKQLSESSNACLSESRLQKTFKCLNTDERYSENKGLYISFFNKINKAPDFYGSQLVADWHKRNLIMYSYIQNQIEKGDKNIVVIVGYGHAAMMYDFFKNDTQFNIINLNNIF